MAILSYANKDNESVDTLIILIRHSTIGETAARVLALIEQGEFELRKDPGRIKSSIKKLGGDPQEEYLATKRLADSGEYAIMWMVRTLQDHGQKALWPRLLTALPKIGKGAVTPLCIALAIDNDDIRQNLIHALGEIGYPHAVPYLHKLIVDEQSPEGTKTAAAAAIERIFSITGRPFAGSASDRFFWLAERYYEEVESVRADARIDQANVWYWDSAAKELTATVVPQRIFGAVMGMRCCEEALRLENDKADAIALWLAANIRREARLGMNTESGDPDETGVSDDTRPANFPRALYFSQAAGPRYAHLVLARAMADLDAQVALGAIEALRVTAGETSLIGTEDYKQPLVTALQFPDPVVRIRAALALGAALPKTRFADSQYVIPVLADALTLTGAREYLVIDPNEANLNRVTGALRAADTHVIGETTFFKAINRARVEFKTLSGVFIATNVADPDLVTALAELRAEFMYAKVPVVLMMNPEQFVLAEEVTAHDAFTEMVDANVDGAALSERLALVAERAGQTPIDAGLALSMALQSAETFRRIAVDGQTVYPFGEGEPALIGALSSTSEQLQINAASVLALARTETAQRSIAHVAMDENNTTTLRIAAFASLAESAKNNGLLLEDHQIAELVRIARDEPDLTIRTAASQALGAVNLESNRASDILRSYYGG